MKVEIDVNKKKVVIENNGQQDIFYSEVFPDLGEAYNYAVYTNYNWEDSLIYNRELKKELSADQALCISNWVGNTNFDHPLMVNGSDLEVVFKLNGTVALFNDLILASGSDRLISFWQSRENRVHYKSCALLLEFQKVTGLTDDEVKEYYQLALKVQRNQLTLEDHSKLKKFNDNKRNLDYLKNTDWYSIRKNDTGIPIPKEIEIKRQEARDNIHASLAR